MRKTFWITQVVLILSLTALYLLNETGLNGALKRLPAMASLSRAARTLPAILTDFKFFVRGSRPPKTSIVIVDIDSPSIETIGRWPWRRDYIAYLVDNIYKMGAKTVGLDMIFSEPQRLVPEELEADLKQRGLSSLTTPFEVDQQLESVFQKYGDRLSLAWASESPCRPASSAKESCPVTDPNAIAQVPVEFPKFSLPLSHPTQVKASKTPVLSAPTVISNLQSLNLSVYHSGFANSLPDSDGVVRNASLVLFVNGLAYPSLPLSVASAHLKKVPSLALSSSHRVESLSFESGPRVPVNSNGMLRINYRGKSRTFPYISAVEILEHADRPNSRGLASTLPSLKDAIVLVGVSALAVGDLATTPFDSLTPGVEVHATLLDNILANDFLISSTPSFFWAILLLMTIGALCYTYVAMRLEGFWVAGFMVVCIFLIGAVDVLLLFPNNYDLNTSFLYLELFGIASLLIGAKYIESQRKRRFIEGAFSKYVSSEVVSSIVKHPEELKLGGKKETLSILFSDIRGFTSLSETLDPKSLSLLLNDYLSLMTEIIFKHHGTLDKYIGDAIMAFWGAPLPQADHAKNACYAACEMMETLEASHERFKKQYGVHLKIGIGIHTGPVTVGNMGSSNAFNYTVIGDNVNLASRLEGSTKFFGSPIVSTLDTIEAATSAGATLSYRKLAPTRVKGRECSVECAEIFSRAPNAQWLETYNKAREAYQKEQWKIALPLFEKALRLRPDDVTTKHFLERCKLVEHSSGEATKDWVLKDK